MFLSYIYSILKLNAILLFELMWASISYIQVCCTLWKWFFPIFVKICNFICDFFTYLWKNDYNAFAIPAVNFEDEFFEFRGKMWCFLNTSLEFKILKFIVWNLQKLSHEKFRLRFKKHAVFWEIFKTQIVQLTIILYFFQCYNLKIKELKYLNLS